MVLRVMHSVPLLAFMEVWVEKYRPTDLFDVVLLLLSPFILWFG